MEKIAILVWSLSEGGSERAASNLSKLLSEQYDIYIILKSKILTYDYSGKIIIIDDNNFEEELFRIKKRENFKCVISLSDICHIANMVTGVGEKTIVSFRNSMLGENVLPDNNVFNNFYRLAYAIVPVSKGVEELLNAVDLNNELNVNTIENVVDEEVLEVKARGNIDEDIKNWLNGSEYIINIGRNVENKQQSLLIQDFINYCERFSEDTIKLIVLGSGVLHEELITLVTDRGYTSRILILEYQDNPFVLLKNAKALISSSKYEGMPNVILEAFALGVPVIATDCWSGPRELLEGRTNYKNKLKRMKICKRGILIPELNEHNKENYIAEAIKCLNSNVDVIKMMLSVEKNFVKNELSKEVIKQKWVNLIEGRDFFDNRIKKYRAEQQMLLSKLDTVIVFGTGKEGKRTMQRIPENKKRFFAVTRKEDTEEIIDGVKVCDIDSLLKYREKAIVFIAVKSLKNSSEIFSYLVNLGFENIMFYALY